MFKKTKTLIALLGVLLYSTFSWSETNNFARKNNSDETYYYVIGVSKDFPVEKFERPVKFEPFMARTTLITFDNELEYLSSLNLDTIYKGTMINESTIGELSDKIIESLHDKDYLFMTVKLDRFAAREGILKVDIKLMNIDNVTVTGPGANDKQMLLYARQLKEESSPAKLSVTEKYLWRVKRVHSYFSSFRFVETANNTIDLMIETQRNMAYLQ